ncbi:phosphatidylinositol-3,5-bisphosphate 5-phosphatase [Dissophora globulifera]|uniref:Phosphatidylinositol-3,5-bisphosphate 5-phosphatase n=1 Tax=Dissophora globulifera TaxID=979702 RepID=A0A9P6RK61_9FUNG|nr:phosphatidylinositol-3,5-bisphosphate 5-phosphatase [Dissophora globulifera]
MKLLKCQRIPSAGNALDAGSPLMISDEYYMILYDPNGPDMTIKRFPTLDEKDTLESRSLDYIDPDQRKIMVDTLALDHTAMPALGNMPPPPNPDLTEFSAFTFPPPPAKPDHVVLNRFVLYETKTRFFIVGTNAPAGTRFRVLKIDRTAAPDELSITEDEAVYTKAEVDDLLEMIAEGNKPTGGMREIAKFYGIVGFVRFTEGYYLTIITKRSPVALIGGHYIFHIDATTTISIHSSTTPTSKLDKNSDEARYLQMFQMVDLSKNFYFSYSYDITRTLQWNMTRSHQVEGRNRMFVWNQYLLENAFGQQMGIENQWALPIMYGFVDQSKLSILGRNVFVTLIARRSRFFAGARFLKRGVNDRGYVANDVETEQIVSEMSTTSFYGAGSLSANPNHTSFVQHRGSIPLYWTQDNTNMSPKPPIELNVIDPYFSAAGLHFDDMFKRYGAPCIVLNLIKAKEKTPRESLLLKEFSECIEYLNQFLPEDKKIWHIKWDMSRASKSRNENVISVLEIIAEKTFAQTGFFHSGFNQDPAAARRSQNVIYGSGLQNGVVRTNCIDCLDRTNAAQFIIAKCALGHQLYSLGLIAEPVVPFDCDVVNMLTEMYHDHGDTIALQYGGSHLVNTMETYRKINQWTSHSRDMIESIRRFYSNSFVDAEKQDAMNLFLGNYRVRKGVGPALWELPGDYHLHNITDPEIKKIRKSYIRWYTPEALLPQDVLARMSFLEAEARGLNQFQLNDGGYDNYDGPIADEFEGEYTEAGSDSGDNRSPGRESPEAGEGRDKLHQIENLRSEDEDGFGAPARVDSMASVSSGQSSQSLTSQSVTPGTDVDQRWPGLASTKMSSARSLSNLQSEGQGSPPLHRQQEPGHGMRSSQSNPTLSSLNNSGNVGPLEPAVDSNKSGQEPPLEAASMLDFKERIVAPFPMDGDNSRAGTIPMSPSSSISSLRKYHQHQLRTSRSRSSLAASVVGSSGVVSRGEQYVYDGFDACDDSPGDPTSAEWEEYWDEYYRPKVQTSFQRLFAYNMNSTTRYIPQNIKNSSEQSPFEVRQNHSLAAQAELNAKTAAKSEKTSMLSWLGLTGGSKDGNGNGNGNGSNSSNGTLNKSRQTNSKAGSGYANGSKTLPLNAGRKKGFMASLEEEPEVQEKSGYKNDKGSGKKDGVAQHARGNRLSLASFPGSDSAEFNEKSEMTSANGGGSFVAEALRAQMTQTTKVRLPAHVPRSKEEEWELTQNVWTNLPQFAIHDPTFVPGSEKNTNSNSGSPVDKSAAANGSGDATTAGGAAAAEGGNVKGRTHLEETVKKLLQPEVTSHESKEYRRYTQQFKTIKFDSVPGKGTASLAGQQAVRTPGGNSSNGQQQQPGELSTMNSMSTERPSLVIVQKMQQGGSSTSTTTIGTTELNEEEEFFYAASRAGVKSSVRNSVPTHGPFSGSTNATGGIGQQQHQSGWDEGSRAMDAQEYHSLNYLPEPPILLAPVQTTIKPPSESEMVLYNAHVELPKLTLYTVGQTSLNPYWGASNGTRLRYDAYMMWILKGRYGYMSMPTTSAPLSAATSSAAAVAAVTSSAGNTNVGGGGVAGTNAVFPGSNPGSTRPTMRRGSSTIYPTVGEHSGNSHGSQLRAGHGLEVISPTDSISGGGSREQVLYQLQQQQQHHQQLQQAQLKQRQQQHRQQQQKSGGGQERKRVSALGAGLG